jgi:hypothetical protein
MAVMRIPERRGTVRTGIVGNRKKKLAQAIVKGQIDPGAGIFTDGLKPYESLKVGYLHRFVDHAIKYVKGHVYTKGMESFWSLLNRSSNGTYVPVVPRLHRALRETSARYCQAASEVTIHYVDR